MDSRALGCLVGRRQGLLQKRSQPQRATFLLCSECLSESKRAQLKVSLRKAASSGVRQSLREHVNNTMLNKFESATAPRRKTKSNYFLLINILVWYFMVDVCDGYLAAEASGSSFG